MIPVRAPPNRDRTGGNRAAKKPPFCTISLLPQRRLLGREQTEIVFTVSEFRVLMRTEGHVSEQDVLGTLAETIQKILARLFHVLSLGLLCHPIYTFQNG